ncbi:MAG TPA: DUF4230 domain-containing protein [Terriglobales bacterium]|nr:DUF4230 domain-containing protein [Terriglobales bacterium]
MPAETDQPPPPTSSRPVGVLVVTGLLSAALGALLVLAVHNKQATAWEHLWSAAIARTSQIDLSQPAVVNRIQQLKRLETVSYNMEKIVSGQREGKLLPDFMVGDRLLLVAHGEVIAGVDFSQLQAADVSVHGKEVRLHLPESRVLLTRLDNQSTRVYSRETGLFVAVDPNLETEVRQSAERRLLESALDDGILNIARQNAQTALTGVLTGLGFTKVDFD